MNKGKVLVVDDDVVLGKILKEFLSGAGFNVKSVYGGAEAIELLRNEEFDLVLCDYIMSNVMGYDVATFLNKMTKKPKIGIITGWSEQIRAREREEMNVDFIIKKPFEFPELEKKINSVLGIA